MIPADADDDANDARFMRLALEQGRRGEGLTSPNPAVGAVIVAAGRVIGEGYHHKAGLPHAEIEALADAKKKAVEEVAGATAYVTLEPCSTQGRTGPCTEALKQAGIKRVVWGARDPNPAHAGRAREVLEQAGIEVVTGVLERECEDLIRPFAKWITSGFPYVIVKAGQSLDGRITRPPGEGQWITNEEAQRHGRALRRRVDAILVGAQTVRQDNPRLTLREAAGTSGKEQPLRVILTRTGRLPEEAHVFTDEHKNRTLVLHDLPLSEVLQELGRRGIVSVLIEGGGNVLAQAFKSQLVDEVYWYIAPLLCGTGVPTLNDPSWEASVGMDEVNIVPMGNNVCVMGRPRWPNK